MCMCVCVCPYGYVCIHTCLHLSIDLSVCAIGSVFAHGWVSGQRAREGREETHLFTLCLGGRCRPIFSPPPKDACERTNGTNGTYERIVIIAIATMIRNKGEHQRVRETQKHIHPWIHSILFHSGREKGSHSIDTCQNQH